MKKSLVFIFLAMSVLLAQDFQYIGTEKCKMCHKSAKKGAQYKIWTEGPHAKAFETLKSEKALEVAKGKGIEGNPWETPECLQCHVTGFGHGGYEVKDEAFWDEKTEKGKPIKAVKRMGGLQAVGCEACHGPGSKYKSIKVKKAIAAGEMDAASVGLLTPNEATCQKCHNESSPTFMPFIFAERVKKIEHPIPPATEK